MDISRFDNLARSLSGLLSRRTIAGGLGVAALGLAAEADARYRKKKKRKKKRKPKVRLNAFGCANVGGFCKVSTDCCSGICTGAGRTRACQAHTTGSCPAGSEAWQCGGASVVCPDTADGSCVTTTGNAGYCMMAMWTLNPPCRRDSDCDQAEPGAACFVCDGSTACGVPAL